MCGAAKAGLSWSVRPHWQRNDSQPSVVCVYSSMVADGPEAGARSLSRGGVPAAGMGSVRPQRMQLIASRSSPGGMEISRPQSQRTRR